MNTLSTHHEIVKDALLFARIEEVLDRKGNHVGIKHYMDKARKHTKQGIYEILCETEEVLTYDELAQVFADCTKIKIAKKITGDILHTNKHFIETADGLYIWHPASLHVISGNGNDNKEVFIIPRDVFDHHSITEAVKIDEYSREATKDWFLQNVLIPAVKVDATDIHIVPKETLDAYKIFFRVLGDLRVVMTINLQLGRAVTQFLLYWSKDYTPSLHTDYHHKPQDGRIEVPKEAGTVNLDLRLSFIPKPNMNDRDVVIRLLYKIDISGSTLHGLGFFQEHERLMMTMALKNKGIILVTGATGTGKSRTVNTILSKIPTARSVYTCEDPVEYLLGNARQFQTFEFEFEGSDKGGKNVVDFGDFARAFKRHDPDVIFIGELRDRETVESAFHLSMTGHLVFATLHCSKATQVPQMLFHKYGVSIDEMADNLIMATNQVLVKRICPECSTLRLFDEEPTWFSLLSYPDKEETLKKLHGKEVRVPNQDIAKTCDCAVKFQKSTISRGYKGRTVLAECVTFDPSMFKSGNLSVMSMDEKTAASSTILHDAVEKVLTGMVDINALWRLV